jgi:microcystin-dependent protein
MNSLNFNQIGGFPLTTRILDEIQKAYSLFNALGAIAGDKTVITGCQSTGLNTLNGVVYVNGEVLEFRGGTTQATVKIFETVESFVFEDNVAKPVVKTRYVGFGTGIGAMNWSGFQGIAQTKAIPLDFVSRFNTIEKKLAIFTQGGAVFPWFKPILEIPEGFQEVLDIRGRTIIGYDPSQTEFKPIGKKEGSKTATLQLPNLPEHDHFIFADETVDAGIPIAPNNQPVKEGYNAGGDGNQNYRIRGTNNAATVGKTSKSGSGSNEAFSILNPYAIAAYIEFIG